MSATAERSRIFTRADLQALGDDEMERLGLTSRELLTAAEREVLMATAPDLTMKQFDTLPIFAAALTQNGAALDLTTATSVTMYFKGASVLVVGTPVTMVLPKTGGNVTYAWQSSDLAVADTYSIEARVVFPAGRLTIPNDGFKSMLVIGNLAGS